MNIVLETIKSRRSVREYTKEQISQESLDLILEAATYAPSAHNEQPWYFTVIQNQDVLDRVNTTCREEMAKTDIEWVKKMGSKSDFLVTYNAPTLIIISGKKDAMAMAPDCSAAIENMLLAAESLGIGSVWLGLVRYFMQKDGSKALLGIPQGYEPFYGVALGYKAGSKELPAAKRTANVINYIR